MKLHLYACVLELTACGCLTVVVVVILIAANYSLGWTTVIIE